MPWPLRSPATPSDPFIPFRKRISGIERRLSAASRKLERLDDQAQRTETRAASLRDQAQFVTSPKLERLEREAADREDDARTARRLVETLGEALATAQRELAEMQEPAPPRKGGPSPPAASKRRKKQRR